MYAGVMAGVSLEERPEDKPDVRLDEVKEGDKPWLSPEFKLGLKFGANPEFKLCVIPDIIILVCSVVSVLPMLYTEEHSALKAIRSSRSFATL